MPHPLFLFLDWMALFFFIFLFVKLLTLKCRFIAGKFVMSLPLDFCYASMSIENDRSLLMYGCVLSFLLDFLFSYCLTEAAQRNIMVRKMKGNRNLWNALVHRVVRVLIAIILISFISSLQESCQNYVRVLVQPSADKLLVCGTNSFRPMCHLYQINTTSYALETEKTGQAVCPYDPQHNSTAVFVGKSIYILHSYS